MLCKLASALHDYRLRWMRRVLERENRIADTVVLQTVMRSDNLFTTTTLLIIAGLISSRGAVERMQAMVSGIGFIAVSPVPSAWIPLRITFVIRESATRHRISYMPVKTGIIIDNSRP